MVHLLGFPRASRHRGGSCVPLIGGRRGLHPEREKPRESNTGQGSKEAGRELCKSCNIHAVRARARVNISVCTLHATSLWARYSRRPVMRLNMASQTPLHPESSMFTTCLYCLSRAPYDSVCHQERILTYYVIWS